MYTPRALCWAEVSASALCQNYQTLQTLAGVPALAMIKADAYGHGALWAARTLEAAAAEGKITAPAFFGVATPEEAMELREGGVTTPILIMGYVSPDWAPILAENRITQTVTDEAFARELSANVPEGCTLRVHLALETGMGRYGFDGNDPEATAQAMARVNTLPGLSVEGLFTHFATADEANDTYTPLQLEKFQNIHNLATKYGVKFRFVHCENSAAVIKYPRCRFDMVRLGIALYGLTPSDETELPEGLRPVLSWYTTVAQVRHLEPGATAGYGRRFTARRPTTLAVLRVGYADGLARPSGHGGTVQIHGQTCPIVANVCMDACFVDVTDVPGVQQGDTVTLVGENADPSALAAAVGTIHYELITRIGKRVPRVPVY